VYAEVKLRRLLFAVVYTLDNESVLNVCVKSVKNLIVFAVEVGFGKMASYIEYVTGVAGLEA
jgi:hypothetical protein